MIVWDRKTTEETVAAGRRPEMAGDKHFLPDSLVEIKPTGKTTGEVVWEWHLWDHLVQDFAKAKTNYGNVALHPELVNINYGEDELPSVTAAKDGKDKATDGKGKLKDGKGNADSTKGGNPTAKRPFRVDPDFTHFNGVAYNADLDQIAVSVWKFSEFWIIDHSTTTAEAASHGAVAAARAAISSTAGATRGPTAPARKQTKSSLPSTTRTGFPRGSPERDIFCCSTTASSGRAGIIRRWTSWRSPSIRRGDIFSSPGTACGPDRPVWSYTAPKKDEFFSSFISGAQRLANGNTLICSGANGTVFEVTPEKEIVWKYVNPVKDGTPFGPLPQPGQIMSQVAGDMLAISTVPAKHLSTKFKKTSTPTWISSSRPLKKRNSPSRGARLQAGLGHRRNLARS